MGRCSILRDKFIGQIGLYMDNDDYYDVKSISPSGKYLVVNHMECFYILIDEGYRDSFNETEHEGKIVRHVKIQHGYRMIHNFVLHDDFSYKKIIWSEDECIFRLYYEIISHETSHLTIYHIAKDTVKSIGGLQLPKESTALPPLQFAI
jgi:hypothetical protein